MALINQYDNQKLKKPGRPLMLKDYLLDDLSSCSSNGFKSFPRRQCCTTVRFLLEIDLKKSKSTNSTKRLLNRSRSYSTTVLQRASEAFINAVKQLPFPSVKSPSASLQNRAKKGRLLPRSFSRKLLKRSFWRKADRDESEIRRWKSFREFLEERNQSSEQNTHHSTTTTTTTTTITTNRVSMSPSSNNNSLDESEFFTTSDILRSSSGNSEVLTANDAVEGKKDLTGKKNISGRVNVPVGEEDSVANNYCVGNTKEWPNEEKEQFSPVSVLDCPFEDEEEINSPFQRRIAHVEGTKQKLMHKIRRFESLAQLEPIDLEKRIALEVNDESQESPMQPCSILSMHNNRFDDNVEENKTEEQGHELLNLIKEIIPSSSFMFKADNLLLEFFRERMMENHTNAHSRFGGKGFKEECLLKKAEEWINGQPQELFLGWEVKDNRLTYVRDMEKNGRWGNLDEEREEVVLELELDFFTSLMEELLIDFS